MILHTETGEDDKKDVKDRILEIFWCKFHYIYPSAFLCFGKKSACLDVPSGVYNERGNENACIRSRYL